MHAVRLITVWDAVSGLQLGRMLIEYAMLYHRFLRIDRVIYGVG
jgi:hypothetical protein